MRISLTLLSTILATLDCASSSPAPPSILPFPPTCDIAASNTCEAYGGFLFRVAAYPGSSTKPTICRNLIALNADDPYKNHLEPYQCLVMLADFCKADLHCILLFNGANCFGNPTLIDMAAMDTSGGKSPAARMEGGRLMGSVQFSRKSCGDVAKSGA